MDKNYIFDRLWGDYTTQNPIAHNVYDLFISEGEDVINDHIAFRTFNDPRVCIRALCKVFTDAGYELKGNYVFENKHLFAKHFEHKEDKSAPRVFISELILEDFSSEFQSIIRNEINKMPVSLLKSDELIFSGNSWGKPSYKVYEMLRTESEYAAWVYVFGYCANHFTVSINHLKKHNTIEKVNKLLKDNGFLLNDSDGEIKGTPEEFLEQSSIKSGIIEIEFQEGKYKIPSCYYEFARRYPDENGDLYTGFIAKSADKIFESTDFYKP
jgi:hypothetical protein